MKRKHADLDSSNSTEVHLHSNSGGTRDADASPGNHEEDGTRLESLEPSKPSSLSEISFKENVQVSLEVLQLIHEATSSITKSKKPRKEDSKREILKKSIPYLLNSYCGTMSSKDQLVLDILMLYSNSKIGLELDTMPLFGPKSFELLTNSSKKFSQNNNPNPLLIHSTRANTILANCIDEKKAYHTCLHYSEAKNATTDNVYNLEFSLSLLCHVLSETNICDGTKVIAHGWIYFIMKGLSLENEKLRKMAFLAYQRLLQNFQQAKAYRNQDIKIWLHFLNAIRRGIQMTGTAKISHLLATWIIAVWKIIKEPTNPMFLCVVHSLFAKPVIEMTILPDFVPFYNNANDKESRPWLLSILYCGLRTAEDWKLIQKSPVIKFLCSSFQLEKVKTQRTIIAILTHGTAIPEVVDELIDKYSILLWLANVRTTNSSLKEEIENFFYVLRGKNILNLSSGTRNYKDNTQSLRETLFEFVAKKQGWTKSVSSYESQCKSRIAKSSETEFIVDLQEGSIEEEEKDD